MKITEYIGSDQEVTIPEEINGFTVQQIGESAFENSEIISVTIPDTVTSIGKTAFKNRKSLATVKFGLKVKEIGESSFQGCVSLTKINVPAYPVPVTRPPRANMAFCTTGHMKYITIPTPT